MVVTIDTNALFAALYSSKGASHQILRLVLDEEIRMAVSANTYFEYYDVLSREKSKKQLELEQSEIEELLDLLALLAQRHEIYFFLRPNLPDEKDNMFVECAFASNSKYLITSNVRDFRRSVLRKLEIEVITPGEFIKKWRGKDE